MIQVDQHHSKGNQWLQVKIFYSNQPVVLLPIHKKVLQTPLQPMWASSDLLEWLCTSLEEWVMPLWHRIRPAAPVDTLLQLIQWQYPLIVSSDASVDAAKHSCCAWSLYGATTCWQGKGIVPGNCDDTYSSRSKAFGILTTLLFLRHYLDQFPLTQLTLWGSTIVYCDNSGTITAAMANSKLTEVFPNHTISDDYDVYQEIGQVVDQLTQFTVEFIHVKGHQNCCTTKKPLSQQAQLNIECDARATRFISYAHRTRQNDSPALPHSYLHLQIHGRVIVWEFPQALWHVANTPDYRTIYRKNSTGRTWIVMMLTGPP